MRVGFIFMAKPSDIQIIGAKAHNLKNISINLKRNSFIVFTGLSGSGKSSLAFDTLYAEGQRRYIESLSAYARQFLGKIEKPAVDIINGISPAIAIEQKVNTRNPRSTVGTTTEIYEYLKLLFARIGKTYAPDGQEVKRHSHKDVLNFLETIQPTERFIILAPTKEIKNPDAWLKSLKLKGYSRIFQKGEMIRLEEVKSNQLKTNIETFILVDRFEGNQFDEETVVRLTDSIQAAFYEGHGKCTVYLFDQKKSKTFNQDFEHNGITYPEPSVHLFTFNNPLGACPTCEGFGSVIGIDPDLVIPDKSLSLYQGAVACWKGDKMKEWQDKFIMIAGSQDFPIHKSYAALTTEQREKLWNGGKGFKGINDFFKYVERKSYKIQYRVMLSRYRGKTACPECLGNRLRKETNNIKINGKNINEISNMSVQNVRDYIVNLHLSKYEKQVSARLVQELKNRLNYLNDVGLGYLTLNRASNSLSGGESQRIQLATSLGSVLVGSMYILDEPSIGLHPRDTEQLIGVLKTLNKLGNTLIVVEHDEDIIKQADEIVDLGPEAGLNGGNVVFQGNGSSLLKSGSITADYLTGKKEIEVPQNRRKWRNFLYIRDAYEHNLKNIDVKIPLQVLTCVTGVSGSGKSSLIKDVLYKALYHKIINNTWGSGYYEKIEGGFEKITQIEMIDQNPIGKSSRSNPVTYLKAYDEIRGLFANLPESKQKGFEPSDFSFNVDGGRCDTCKGEGEVTVEMQFMADIKLTCDECKGNRFKEEIVDIRFQEKSITDVLKMTIDEAMEFFRTAKLFRNKCDRIAQKLSPLQEVGLGYVQLGQSSSTLSGGEAQRVKLAFFLSRRNTSDSILFLFDEPSTGLHFHDVKKLLKSLNALIAQGHTVVIIEHHLDIIKSADWVIDLGPEGGDEGGHIVFEGIPEDLVNCKDSYTGKYLREKIIRP